ncbi:MAG TPA: hypothetical protein VF765_14420 [Polyangiaceae bacterium]
MRTGLLFSGTALIGLCLVSAFPGCGSSSSNGNNPSTDGGNMADTSSDDSSSGGDDGSSGDANEESSSSSGGDTGTGCTASVMPKGMQVLASVTDTVQGVTSDGQIIFYDGSTMKLNAVPVGGGTPKVIGPWDKSQSLIFTSNGVALYWNGATQTSSPHGALSIWSASGGAQTLGTQSYFSSPNGGGWVDVSADGSLVVYSDNATTGTADIYVAGSDGSNKTKIVSAASIGAACRPVVRFAGNTPVVAYCTAQPDAGTTLNATVAAYSGPPTWQTVQQFTATGFYGFTVAPLPGGDGGASAYQVEYLDSTGMYVEPLGGTTPTLIDAKSAGGATFTHSGTDIIYIETDGSVWRSPVATPAPGELAKGPFQGTLALSSDDNWLEVFSQQNMTTFFTDMYLLSTTPADGGNTPTTLASMASGANFGDPFTTDNSRAIFFPNVVMSGSAGYVGAYDSLTLPPSGMPKTIAQNVWEEFATSGAKTLYNDNYASNAGFAGAADIESVDLGGTASATTLVSQADANFFLTADKKTIVYSWSACPGAKAGIYTLAAP